MLTSKLDIPIGIGREFDAKNMGGHKAFLKQTTGTKVRFLYIYSCYSKNIIGDKKKK
jgi:hypothetical protein